MNEFISSFSLINLIPLAGLAALLVLAMFVAFRDRTNLYLVLFAVVLGKLALLKFEYINKNANIYYFDLVFVVAFTGLILQIMTKRQRLEIAGPEKWIFALVLLGLMTAPFALNIYRFLAWWKIILFSGLMFVFAYNAMRTIDDIRYFFIILIVIGTIIAIESLVMWEFNLGRTSVADKEAFSLGWGRNNYLASIFAFIVPIAFGACFERQFRRFHKFFMGGISLMILGILLSQSRGALCSLIMGLLLGLFLAFTYQMRKTFKRSLLIAVAVILVGAVAWWAMPGEMGYRWLVRSNAAMQLDDRGFSGRFSAWEFSWATFQKHPILGIGLGNQQLLRKVQEGSEGLSHNLYLHTLCELGLVGGFILAALLISWWRHLFRFYRLTNGRKWNGLAFGLIISFITVMIDAAVEPSFWGAQYTLFFWMTMGATYKLMKELHLQPAKHGSKLGRMLPRPNQGSL